MVFLHVLKGGSEGGLATPAEPLIIRGCFGPKEPDRHPPHTNHVE